ncbi:major facilitator superfamily transporter protein [Rutstroemia sp. NJR-2017a BBW]|nr:major facilitator superfamily transporter protein [Rutstroemia sp. NJR-2017a BBW]
MDFESQPEISRDSHEGIKLAVIIASLAASVFLCALVRKKNAPLIIVAVHSVVLSFPKDETIVATATPRITDDFTALNDVGWYGSAEYALLAVRFLSMVRLIDYYASSFMTFAAFQLIFGKLFTFYSTKKVFIVLVAIFEVGSLICATAPTSIAFIVGRACAGLGSAGINAGFIMQVVQRDISYYWCSCLYDTN